MRIGLISREFPPFFGGGIGSYTRRWAIALRDAGHEPTVITVGGGGVREDDRLDEIPVIRLPFLIGDDWAAGPHPRIRSPRTLAAFTQFWGGSVFAMHVEEALPAICREHRLEAIEAPDTGALAWFALNRRRTDPGYHIAPVVLVVHSPSAWVDRLNRASPCGRPERELASMEHDSARMADALVCPSNDLARHAESLWGMEHGRIHVVPNPLGDIAPEPDAIPGPPGRIAFFGRVEYRKGVDTLLAAFEDVGSKHPGSTLDIVGEDAADPDEGGSMSALLTRRFPKGADRVRFHGKLPPERVREMMRAVGVVVVPSPDDNFPYTCVEAMAAGRVVVASRAGGMRDMIRDGIDGLLFSPSDPRDLARVLCDAITLDEPARLALARRAVERITMLCGNGVIVRQRLEIADRMRARGAASRAADSPYVILGRPTRGVRSALESAMANPSIDFAYPWSRTRRGIECLGPASHESLRDATITTLAVRRSAIESVGAGRPREVVVRLAEAGFHGAPLPHVIEPRGALFRLLARGRAHGDYAPA